MSIEITCDNCGEELCGSGLDLGAIDAPRLRSRRPQGHLRSAAGRRVR
jgi:hypothetical protein